MEKAVWASKVEVAENENQQNFISVTEPISHAGTEIALTISQRKGGLKSRQA